MRCLRLKSGSLHETQVLSEHQPCGPRKDAIGRQVTDSSETVKSPANRAFLTNFLLTILRF